MKADVYYDLHRGTLSARVQGRVRLKSDTILVRDAKFIVQPAGKAKARETQQKNVHAFVRGTVHGVAFENEQAAQFDTERRVTYNPYKYDTFVDATTEEPVYEAPLVWIEKNRIYAYYP